MAGGNLRDLWGFGTDGGCEGSRIGSPVASGRLESGIGPVYSVATHAGHAAAEPPRRQARDAAHDGRRHRDPVLRAAALAALPAARAVRERARRVDPVLAGVGARVPLGVRAGAAVPAARRAARRRVALRARHRRALRAVLRVLPVLPDG